MKRRQLLQYSTLLVASGCAPVLSRGNTQPLVINNQTIRQPDRLRLAVSDVKGLDDLKQDYEELRLLLEQILEIAVTFVPVDSYIAAASALQLEKVDLIFTGPSEYVVMRARADAILLFGIERAKYYSIIAVRADSAIKTVAELRNKTVAMWEIGSTSGHLGPTKLLLDHGLNPQSNVKINLMGKQGLPALNQGKVDAWGGSIQRYEKFLQETNLSPKDFPIIAQGETLPPDPFVVSSKLDPIYRSVLKQRLLLDGDAILKTIITADGGKFRGGKVVNVEDQDFDEVRLAYKAIGQGGFLNK